MQQYTAKESEAWRSGNWSEWICTNCQTVGWSGQKKCRNCRGEKELRSSFYDQSSLLEGMDTTETKQHVTGLSATTTSGGTATICMCKRSSTSRSKLGRAFCRIFWVQGGHTQVERALSSLDMDAPALEAARKLLEQQLTELKTQQKAQQTVEQKIGKREESSAESSKESRRSEIRVHSDPDCQRAGGPGSSENTIRTLHTRTEAHKAATEATGARPLDRCSDIIDNTITAHTKLERLQSTWCRPDKQPSHSSRACKGCVQLRER